MATGEVRTYDFKNYKHVWGGVPITGFDEEGITIIRPDDMFGAKTGCEGERERANLNNFHVQIVINLFKTNPLNGILSGLHEVDARLNTSKLPWLTKDLDGLTTVGILRAWITKQAEISLKRESDGMVWTFDTGPAAVFTGGTLL